jgi:hypothetical protein
VAAPNTNLIMNPIPKIRKDHRDMRELSNLILLKHMCGRDKEKEKQIKNIREKLTETQEKCNEYNREKIELKDKYHELENKHKNLKEKFTETQEKWDECNREKMEWEDKCHRLENDYKRREKCYQEQIKIFKRNQELTDKEKRKKDEIDKMKSLTEMNRKRLASWESTSTISDVGIFTLEDGMNDQLTPDQSGGGGTTVRNSDRGEKRLRQDTQTTMEARERLESRRMKIKERILKIKEETQVKLIGNQEEQKKLQRKEYMQGEFKRLEATRWPHPENFATHGDFYTIVVSHAEKLLARGHPQDLIAESLDNFLMSSKKAPKYGAVALRRDTSTLEGALDALEACDIVYMGTTGEERFNNIKRHPGEDLEGYMARCANSYDKMGNGDPNHSKARPRRIKEQFFKGANIERSYADRFMGMNDLDSLVARVIKDEEEETIIYEECKGTEKEAYAEVRQGNTHPTGSTTTEKPRGWEPSCDTSPNEKPRGWESDGCKWPPIHVVQEGQGEIEETEEEMKGMREAPPGARWAPIRGEHEGEIDLCRRCGQGDHVTGDCEFRRYGGYCKEQTDDDDEQDHTDTTHNYQRFQTNNNQ